MIIEKDNSYSNKTFLENGIATEQPFKVNFYRRWGKDITPLMDEIERTFKVYQYRKGNGVEYGDHELFFWTNDDPACLNTDDHKMNYFYLHLNDRKPQDERLAVLTRLLAIVESWDGTPTKGSEYPSCACVDYHAELIDRETLHLKALERVKEMGNRKCECCGMVGRFRHDARGLVFQKFRTSKFYNVTDEAAACARLVA